MQSTRRVSYLLTGIVLLILLVLMMPHDLFAARQGAMTAFDCQFATAELHRAGFTDLTVVDGTFEVTGPRATNVLYLHAHCTSSKGGVAFVTLKCEGDPHSPSVSIIKMDRR